jgi:hypothetical protein
MINHEIFQRSELLVQNIIEIIDHPAYDNSARSPPYSSVFLRELKASRSGSARCTKDLKIAFHLTGLAHKSWAEHRPLSRAGAD